MGQPAEKFKLPSRMGNLIRYTATGPWTWQWYDARRKKNVCVATNQTNRSRAEQFVYQRAATRSAEFPRYQGTQLLFKTVAENYCEARQVGNNCKRLRPSTLTAVRQVLRAFEQYVGAGYDSLLIDAVDTAMLKGFIETQRQHISVDTANARLTMIRRVLEYAHKKGYILHIPETERAYEAGIDEGDGDNDDGIEGWPCPTAEDVRLILAHSPPQLVGTGRIADNGSATGRRVFVGINANDYTDLYATICLTGLRIGEACHLTWEDVDLVNKVVLVRPGRKNGTWWQPKTTFGVRRIAIVPELEVILHRQRENNSKNNWVFETYRGTQCHPHNVSRRFRQICDGLGFKKRYVVHSLRKYWASTVAQQGLDWKLMIKMFGHSDFELILRTYYAQNDDARMVAEASKIDFGLGLPKTG